MNKVITFLVCMSIILMYMAFNQPKVTIVNNYYEEKTEKIEEKIEVEKPQIEIKKDIKENKKENYLTQVKWSHRYTNRQNGRENRYGISTKDIKINKKFLLWKGKQYLTRKELETLAKQVFSKLPHIKTNENTVKLIIETAITESKGGYILQNKYGDYGVFQIKEYVSKDLLTWLKNTHKDIYTAIISFRNDKLSEKDNLMKNIPYSIALCVTEYWRKAGGEFYNHIDTRVKRGIMWKSVYNTSRGLGTVQDYISRNEKYI